MYDWGRQHALREQANLGLAVRDLFRECLGTRRLLEAGARFELDRLQHRVHRATDRSPRAPAPPWRQILGSRVLGGLRLSRHFEGCSRGQRGR